MRTTTRPTAPTKKTPTPAIWANIDPELRATLRELGVIHPDSFTTKQAASYLSQIKGIPTAKSTLEVFRCQGRGPRYRKIGSRVFYMRIPEQVGHRFRSNPATDSVSSRPGIPVESGH